MLPAKTLLGFLAGFAAAQFPPAQEGLKVIRSRFHENVTITYKEPGICETVPDVKSYAGWVGLPAGFLDDTTGRKQNYSVNTFFWFFEARHDPANAPLAIWLNGGPGGSSLLGLLAENGPCFIGEDSQSVIHNPWSWNNHVNMLYIDEPNQVGLSYDIPTNVTIFNVNESYSNIVPTDFTKEPIHTNLTTQVGTFSSQKSSSTVNSTEQAAHALWHFAQTFFTEFPHYKPNDDRIGLWAESYGGHYGPGFFRFFQEQNEKIMNDTIGDEHAHYLHLDTLGIINGYIDSVLQEEASIVFPFNNTYGIQIFNETVYDDLIHKLTRSGGCRDQIIKCRKSLASRDQNVITTAQEMFSNLCPGLELSCMELGEGAFAHAPNRAARFDISHGPYDPFPPPYMHGYLSQEKVLGALGSPVNFTWASAAVSENFERTLDIFQGGYLDAIGYLLDSGVKVHMMYGDRDFACNWIGGEMASLAVPFSRAEDFKKAGYAELIDSEGVAGLTRQFGNFSFTRVFQSGHMIPSYQPEAAYEIFMRATFNRDIPTGLLPVHDELSTIGPSDTWHVKQAAPEAPAARCYILMPDSCEPEVWEKVKNGNVTVKDFFVVDDEGNGSSDEDQELELDGEL